QAEDGIRDRNVTGVQTCALPIYKRLSNRWMARVAFSVNDWTEHYDGAGAVQNPTRTDSTSGGVLSGPQVDGGQIAPRSGGSGKRSEERRVGKECRVRSGAYL